MFGKNVDSEKVPTEGITKITAADFEYANAAEYTICLLYTSLYTQCQRCDSVDGNTLMDRQDIRTVLCRMC